MTYILAALIKFILKLLLIAVIQYIAFRLVGIDVPNPITTILKALVRSIGKMVTLIIKAIMVLVLGLVDTIIALIWSLIPGLSKVWSAPKASSIL